MAAVAVTARGTLRNGCRASAPNAVATSNPMNAARAGSTPAATPTSPGPSVSGPGEPTATPLTSNNAKTTTISVIATLSISKTTRADSRTPRRAKAPTTHPISNAAGMVNTGPPDPPLRITSSSR